MRALLLTALLIPTAADAGALREPVMDLLNAYEDTATAEQLSALGEGVTDELMEIAVDGEVPSSRRGRAVSALGHFPADDTRAFLDARLADADTSSLIRRKAAYALAAGWGEGAVRSLAGALADDDVQLRIAAAHALGELSDQAAKDALEARLAVEDSDAARDAIEKALGSK